jgi:hypothetical protein
MFGVATWNCNTTAVPMFGLLTGIRHIGQSRKRCTNTQEDGIKPINSGL